MMRTKTTTLLPPHGYFPLKSVQISQIIAPSEDRNITFWRHHSRHDEPPLRGIPDKAVEFQILLHLLRHEVGQRLEDMHEVMAGRCRRPTELQEDLAPWEDFVFGAVENFDRPDSLLASSLPLQEVVAMLFEGKRVESCRVPQCKSAVSLQETEQEQLQQFGATTLWVSDHSKVSLWHKGPGAEVHFELHVPKSAGNEGAGQR